MKSLLVLREQLKNLPAPVRKIFDYMFKAYIVWSICADFIIIGGIIYLIFF